jgi:proprotein convertase subtilisin/kexin type 5
MVTIIPNLTSIVNKTLSLVLEGVVSGSNMIDYVPVSTYTSANAIIDTGTMLYELSCRDNTTATILNNCKTCFTNHSCIDCYLTLGFYLNGSICVSSCGLATYYPNNVTGTCTLCTNNCYTCSSATYCITCNTNYYLLSDNTCVAVCPASGYIASTVSSVLYCTQCYGSGACLQCTSVGVGFCTICSNNSVLSGGICTSSCANSSLYPSGGICYPCDASCSTCTSGGNGGCIKCSSSYYNYSSYCLSSCPTGTAPSNGTCSCSSPCSTCQGTPTNCTACLNASLFVSLGSCLSSCPGSSYLSGSSCLPCPTACSSCSATTCLACLASYYLYNNTCYSSCKQLGLQYDSFGSSCALCPSGCSTCPNSTCTSCLANYTLTSPKSQCI